LIFFLSFLFFFHHQLNCGFTTTSTITVLHWPLRPLLLHSGAQLQSPPGLDLWHKRLSDIPSHATMAPLARPAWLFPATPP
jgi:hypothetical protein